MPNKIYYLYAGNAKITVSCEVYKAYFSELDKERYINRRALKNEVSVEGGDSAINPERAIEDSLIERELHKALGKALGQLSEEEYQLLNDIYFLGLSERSAAEQRGIHYMTLRNRKLKILKKLRGLMEEEK